MEESQILSLDEGSELRRMEVVNDQFIFHVQATADVSICPLCQQPATRIHSQYYRVISELPCIGHQGRIVLHVRRFFCESTDCLRKIFTERLPHLVAPWSQMSKRLCLAVQAVGLSTGGRLGQRLAARLGIRTSRTTIVRQVMALPTQTAETIPILGVDDFSFRRGRAFGTVLVDLQTHQICDLLPNRQVETVATWMLSHPEITIVSRDRGSEYASAASQGAPQAVQVADRFHIAKNLTKAVQNLLARVLPELKIPGQEKDVSELTQTTASLPIEEWRPAQEESVKQTIATRRAERQDHYQQVMALYEQKMTSQEIANHLGMKARTVRDWLHKKVAPDTRPRRKQQSDFDQYAPYVLKRWRQGEQNGRQLWREIAAQGFTGSERMVYRFLETLKTTEILLSAGFHRLPHYTSNTAVWLFVRDPEALDEIARQDLDAFRLAHPTLDMTYRFVQDFWQMLRHREGDRLETWLEQIMQSQIPELQRFARGVERDKIAVQSGLTHSINNGPSGGASDKI